MKRLACAVLGTLAGVASTIVYTAPAPAAVPTFAKDVAPIVFEKCVTCHRLGEVAPMTLLSYEDVRPWAKVIKTKVMGREMPPWGADPEHSLESLVPEDPLGNVHAHDTVRSAASAGG